MATRQFLPSASVACRVPSTGRVRSHSTTGTSAELVQQRSSLQRWRAAAAFEKADEEEVPPSGAPVARSISTLFQPLLPRWERAENDSDAPVSSVSGWGFGAARARVFGGNRIADDDTDGPVAGVSRWAFPGAFSCADNGEYYQTFSMEEELLKEKQMSIFICIASIVSYFGWGFWIGRRQGWSLIDSFYTTVVTFTTVGYGDFDFGTQDGDLELLGVFFIVIGVFIFGASLSLFFSYVLEEEQSTILAHARDREMGRERQIYKLNPYAKLRRCLRRRVAPVPEDNSDEDVGLAVAVREEAVGRLKVNITIALCREMSILCFGATVLGGYEHWDWRMALYWAVTTATTVGFGDVVPSTEFGRLLASILILLSVCSLTHTMSVLASYRTLMNEVRARHEVLTQFGTTLTEEEFETLTHGPEVRALRLCSDSANITQAEFCIYMLHKLGRVAKEELLACQDAFDKLDITHTGKIDSTDLKAHEKRRKTMWGSGCIEADQDSVKSSTSLGTSPTHGPHRRGSSGWSVFTVKNSKEECSNCGSMFMEDAEFCRKCGKPRPKPRHEDETKEKDEGKLAWLKNTLHLTDHGAPFAGKKLRFKFFERSASDGTESMAAIDSANPSRFSESMPARGSDKDLDYDETDSMPRLAQTVVGCVANDAE